MVGDEYYDVTLRNVKQTMNDEIQKTERCCHPDLDGITNEMLKYGGSNIQK